MLGLTAHFQYFWLSDYEQNISRRWHTGEKKEYGSITSMLPWSFPLGACVKYQKYRLFCANILEEVLLENTPAPHCQPALILFPLTFVSKKFNHMLSSQKRII